MLNINRGREPSKVLELGKAVLLDVTAIIADVAETTKKCRLRSRFVLFTYRTTNPLCL